MGKSREFENVENDAYRIRSLIEVLMPGSLFEPEDNKEDTEKERNIIKSIENKYITLGELQYCAKNVLRFIVNFKNNKLI